MNLVVVGLASGAFVAYMSCQFGVVGFLLSVLFMGAGAVLGRVAGGKLDLRGVWEALTGRRSSS